MTRATARPPVRWTGRLGLLASALTALVAAAPDRSAALADPAAVQEKCEWQAEHSFLAIKDDVDADPEFRERSQKISIDYQAHYNAALGRCLMLIEMSAVSPRDIARTAYIVDADAPSREYAFYRDIGGTPLVCEIKPSAGRVRYCASRNDFDAFVVRYMDQ